jgi:hypothetical protein
MSFEFPPTRLFSREACHLRVGGWKFEIRNLKFEIRHRQIGVGGNPEFRIPHPEFKTTATA